MKNKKVCVMGLGYVGLPLAIAFAEKMQVTGFDINPSRIKELKNGHDKSLEIDDKLLNSVKNNITFTSKIEDTEECDIYIVTVPTPVDKFNRPDLTPLIEASQTIGSVLSKNNIVIYESEARHFACVRYGGYSNSNKFKANSKKLIKKLSELNIKTVGDLFYVSYNSPYKVFNRRNEVMIEIEYID